MGLSKLNLFQEILDFSMNRIVPNQDIPVTGNLTSNALADAFAAIERNDIRVATIFCNAKDYSDLRKWDRDILDPDSQAQVLKTGIRAGVWNATIITSRVVLRMGK